MKKIAKTLLIFSMMAVSVLGMASISSAKVIEVTAKNFPDAVIRNALKEYATEENVTADTGFHIDTDKVTSLRWITNVKNLTGIDLLTKLEELSFFNFKGTKIALNNSRLKMVDVSSDTAKKLTVQVPKMETLIVSGTKLTSLDISKATSLKDLCVWSDKMTSLNVSKYKKLKGLRLYCKALTSLDVSKNKNLEILRVQSAKLKPVKVNKNTKLKELSIDSSKKIKSVDTGKNKKLTALSLTNMKIKKIDITKNKKLTGFACYGTKVSSLNLKKHTKLTTLNVSNTKLKALDLSKHTKLISLDVSNTKISSLNLKKAKGLLEIGFYGSKISKLDLTKFKGQNLTILYKDVKKGSTINLKPFLGTGYNDATGYDSGFVYNKSKNTIKVPKKNNPGSVMLQKGKKTYFVTIWMKEK